MTRLASTLVANPMDWASAARTRQRVPRYIQRELSQRERQVRAPTGRVAPAMTATRCVRWAAITLASC